jgi:hypothetical protein
VQDAKVTRTGQSDGLGIPYFPFEPFDLQWLQWLAANQIRKVLKTYKKQ